MAAWVRGGQGLDGITGGELGLKWGGNMTCDWVGDGAVAQVRAWRILEIFNGFYRHDLATNRNTI